MDFQYAHNTAINNLSFELNDILDSIGKMGSQYAPWADLENLFDQILDLENYVNDVSGGGSIQPKVDDLQFQVEEV